MKNKKQSKIEAKKYESNAYEPNKTLSKENKDMSMNNIVGLAWGAKEILRDDFKKTEWSKNILPFLVLRRLGRVLEPTKNKVILEYEKIQKEKPEYIEAKLNKITGYSFHNHSKYNLELLLADDKNILKNLQAYIRGFSDNVKDIFENFSFDTTIIKLDKHDLLYQFVQRFASSELDFDPKKIDNHMMGTIYEEVVRRANEATNEEAGHHFTPREVIKLMTSVLFSHEKEKLKKKGIVRTIYDPASGTGGMLSIASEYIEKINPEAIIDVFGQELNEETYAVCKSDMLIKGLELDRIKQGNSLIRGKNGDGFPDSKFHYMLSNPPFGVDWGKYERGILTEREMGFQGKFGAGIPRKSDGAMLFLLSMISKMKSKEDGGSRIAIVLNGSPMFTGESGSGESEIRKWIIENDMLETIIGLPNEMFYNTPINTFIWIVTNNKEKSRKGKVQLVDVSNEKFYKNLKLNLGKKRNFIDDDQIESITKIYETFKKNDFCKILDNEDFGHTKIVVERPLKRNFKILDERIQKLKQDDNFLKLDNFKEKPNQPKCKDILNILSKLPSKTYIDYSKFSEDLKKELSRSSFKISTSLQKTIEDVLSERDEKALPQKNKDGDIIPDPQLRDYEIIPLKENIKEYFKKNVLAYVPDAWIDESKNKKGYEISFVSHFYKYKSLRTPEEISKEISELQNKIFDEFKELSNI